MDNPLGIGLLLAGLSSLAAWVFWDAVVLDHRYRSPRSNQRRC